MRVAAGSEREERKLRGEGEGRTRLFIMVNP
jgi:hypothetical protein